MSAHRMRRKSAFPPATVPFAVDSDGHNHLLREGRWTTSPREYAEHAQRIKVETGKLEWAAVQDWDCTPAVLAKTGKTVLEHQQRTLESYFELQHLAPRVRWVPTLQGFSKGDYLKHVEMYRDAGADLRGLSLVAAGSVGSRQTAEDVVDLFSELSAEGMSLHAFGIRLEGLERSLPFLRSSDAVARSAFKDYMQPDAEAYRRLVLEEVRKAEEYVEYDGILGFFPGEG